MYEVIDAIGNRQGTVTFTDSAVIVSYGDRQNTAEERFNYTTTIVGGEREPSRANLATLYVVSDPGGDRLPGYVEAELERLRRDQFVAGPVAPVTQYWTVRSPSGYILPLGSDIEMAQEAYISGGPNRQLRVHYVLLREYDLSRARIDRRAVAQGIDRKAVEENDTAARIAEALKSPSSVEVIETGRTEVFCGAETRRLDNRGTDATVTRIFKVSKEYSQTYSIAVDRSEVRGFSLDVSHLLVGPAMLGAKANAEKRVQRHYSISQQTKQVHEEQIEIPIPGRANVELIIEWKHIHQQGVVRLRGRDERTVVDMPFDVVVGMTFDQRTVAAG